jgi:hypothetical protein
LLKKTKIRINNVIKIENKNLLIFILFNRKISKILAMNTTKDKKSTSLKYEHSKHEDADSLEKDIIDRYDIINDINK